jgi:hypothetical protein
MDPVFAVLLDLARLASHQPPAIRQTWGMPECISQPETAPDGAPKPVPDGRTLNWFLSLSLKPR